MSPSPPRGMIRSTVPFCVASSASSSRPPPATRLTQPSGSPSRHRGLARDPRQRRVGVKRRGGAPQDDRVARLQAQRGGVDRHVRACLVDDRHHPERHPHLAHVQAIGQTMPVDHLADRVAQRHDLPDRLRDRIDPSLVQQQPVEQRRARAGLAPRLHVARVRLQDLLGALAQRHRDLLQRRVLRRGVHPRQRFRRALGRATDIRDRRDDGGHGSKGRRSANHEVVAVHGLVSGMGQDLATASDFFPMTRFNSDVE